MAQPEISHEAAEQISRSQATRTDEDFPGIMYVWRDTHADEVERGLMLNGQDYGRCEARVLIAAQFFLRYAGRFDSPCFVNLTSLHKTSRVTVAHSVDPLRLSTPFVFMRRTDELLKYTNHSASRRSEPAVAISSCRKSSAMQSHSRSMCACHRHGVDVAVFMQRQFHQSRRQLDRALRSVHRRVRGVCLRCFFFFATFHDEEFFVVKAQGGGDTGSLDSQMFCHRN